MRNKTYSLDINKENKDAYRDLYNARQFLTKENIKELGKLAWVIIPVMAISPVICMSFLPEIVAEVFIFTILSSGVLMCFKTSNLIKKQVESVKEKYPFVDLNIPNYIIDNALMKYDKKEKEIEKEKIKQAEKDFKKVCEILLEIKEEEILNKRDKIDELYVKMGELQEIVERRKLSEQDKTESEAYGLSLINSEERGK